MGIMEQVDAMRRNVLGFVSGDGPRREVIAHAWSVTGDRDVDRADGGLSASVTNRDSAVARVVADDHRLLHVLETEPRRLAGASARIDPAIRESMERDGDPRPLANRLLYDVAVQRFAAQTLRQDGRARIPVELYDLVGAKAADRVLDAVLGLERPLRERIAGGSMQGLPDDFMAKVVEPLPRMERNHSDSDRRRESAGLETARGSRAKGFRTDEETAPVVGKGVSAGR